MRAVFSILGLVIVLAVVGFIAKSQLAGSPAPKVIPSISQATSQGFVTPTVKPGTTAAEQSQQSQQIQQQFKHSVETALQPARAMSDDK